MRYIHALGEPVRGSEGLLAASQIGIDDLMPRPGKAGIAIVFDVCVVLLFVFYLATAKARTEEAPA